MMGYTVELGSCDFGMWVRVLQEHDENRGHLFIKTDGLGAGDFSI